MEWEKLSRTLSGRTPSLMDAKREYAVLIPLVEQEGEVHLLFEVRAATLRRQPGEICFPGGRIEGSENPVDAALRETEEELGISSQNIQVLGQLDFIAHRANFLIHPVLARCDTEALGHLNLNPQEVAETFLVPLSHLRNHPRLMGECALVPQPEENFPYADLGVPEDYHWQPGRETISAYHWKEHIIWGLTARITRHLISLLPEEGQ